MIRALLCTLALAGCVRPLPTTYCPYTCSTIHATWEAEMDDPNDGTRLRWCVCRDGAQYTALPPRRPQ